MNGVKRPVNLGTAKSVPGKKGKHQEWRGNKLKDWISASLSALPIMCLECGNTDKSKIKLLVETDDEEPKLWYSAIRCMKCGWRSDEHQKLSAKTKV